MAACFQLIPKGTEIPEPLNYVDERICAQMGEPVHPHKWVFNWHGVIGFKLALGDSWEKVKADLAEDGWPHSKELLQVADWLEKHYEVRCWRG